MFNFLISNVFLNYILPVLIVAVVAALLGFGLSFLGEKFAVTRDERIDHIREHLAGANCGGCGYAGCDAYAEALFKGEATLDACNPTSGEEKAYIANIMGLKVDKSRPQVAIVHCNGGHNCKDKGGYVGYGDCISADMLSGGTKACSVGCMGLSTCVNVCGYDAVRINKDTGASHTNDNCIACGACVRSCPKHLLSFIPKDSKVYVACSNTQPGKEVTQICAKGCIACKICEKNCPHDAIKVKDNLAIIDYEKCTGCGICADKCPRHTIIKR